jgi:hypothetical protein
LNGAECCSAGLSQLRSSRGERMTFIPSSPCMCGKKTNDALFVSKCFPVVISDDLPRQARDKCKRNRLQERRLLSAPLPFIYKNDHFAKTGSGQT